jgi:hypothetical protein
MTNELVKIDRVRSVDEAVAVERLGVGMVGVALGPDPRFDDDRAVPVELAAEIGKSLRHATLVAAMDLGGDPGRVLRIAGSAGAGLVQSGSGAVPPPEVRAALAGAGIGIVYAGIEISHDDDPSWVLSRYADVPDLGAVLFQADVLGEYRDSWRFLLEESPAYPEEFQIDDLNQLGREHDLVATLDFTPANVAEIAAGLPGIRGVALPLGDRAARGDVHRFTFDEAVAVLTALGGSARRA